MAEGNIFLFIDYDRHQYDRYEIESCTREGPNIEFKIRNTGVKYGLVPIVVFHDGVRIIDGVHTYGEHFYIRREGLYIGPDDYTTIETTAPMEMDLKIKWIDGEREV